MKLTIPTTEPFSFDQTLTFIRRFPGCQAQVRAGDDRVTAALSANGRGWVVILRAGVGHDVIVELPAGAPRDLARRAAAWIGADDDVGALYDRARGDRAFAPVIAALHGLHHVRFLGLEDIAVHCVLMQRQAPLQVARMKRRFLAAFGHAVDGLHAMPELPELATLSPAAIGKAIGHAQKAERIAAVVRGVAELGEGFLRTAPYDRAKQALLAIPGVGAFSATAILLRGLGRHDQNPVLSLFEADARRIYGAAWDASAIAHRYGDQIGYWTYYLKTGVARD
jgi:DNA-3-methyladenine glycosylase II